METNALPSAHGEVELLNRKRPTLHSRAPRIPSEAQVNAPVHISFALWRTEYRDTFRYSWVVTVNSPEEKHKHESQATGVFPADQILASIVRQVRATDRPVWVNVPESRISLANRLLDLGISVTIGYHNSNRATDRAISIKTKRREFQAKQAASSYWRNLPAALPDSVPSHAVEHNYPEYYWWPLRNRNAPYGLRNLVVATDASKDAAQLGAGGIAAISNNGDLRLLARETKANICELELDAISLGVELVTNAKPRRATIIADNRTALLIASEVMRTGLAPMRKRGISDQSINRFRNAISMMKCPIELRWVRGHADHPLHDSADELANIGRLACQHAKQLVEAELDSRISVISNNARLLNRTQCLATTAHLDCIQALNQYQTKETLPNTETRLSNTIAEANPAISARLAEMFGLAMPDVEQAA